MEPKLELTTVITSHVWLIHELSPKEPRVDSILNNSQWKKSLIEQAANDYARLRMLMDLADFVFEQPWDPQNPLGEFLTPQEERKDFVEKLRIATFGPKPSTPLSRGVTATSDRTIEGTNDEARRTAENDRRQVAELAVEVLSDRMKTLTEQGFAEDLHPISALPEGTLDFKKTFSPALLTREELFELVGNWLLQLPSAKVIALANAFLCANRFLIMRNLSTQAVEISGLLLDAKKQAAREWLRKSDEDRLKAVLENTALFMWSEQLGVPVSISSADRFVMSREIRRRAEEITSSPSLYSKMQVDRAAEWLGNSDGNETRKLDMLFDDLQLRDLCCTLDVAVPFSMVLKDELREIASSRCARLYTAQVNAMPNSLNATPGAPVQERETRKYGVLVHASLPYKRAFGSNLFGFALSGGGIRSATFGLGLLQGMADRNILPYVDLISTVSGGGYIASWLIAWIKRRGAVDLVQQSLRGSASWLKCEPTSPKSSIENLTIPSSTKEEACTTTGSLEFVTRNSDPRADHARPIRLLREYARYLAPQAGLLSTDTWTIFSTWLRNTVLNLSVLTLFLGVALLLPRLVILVLLHARILSGPLWGALTSSQKTKANLAIVAVVLITGIPLLIACWLTLKHNLRTFGPYAGKKDTTSRGFDDSEIVRYIMPWFLVGAFLEVAMLWNFLGLHPRLATWASLAFGFVVVFGIWILSGMWPFDYRVSQSLPLGVSFIAVFGSAAAGLGLVYGLSRLMKDFGSNTMRGVWLAGSVGISLMLLIMVTVGLVFLALAGRELSDEQREWWSRLGAWFLLAMGGWLLMCGICFFVPLWLPAVETRVAALGITWGSITAVGASMAFSANSGRNSGGKEPWYYKPVLAVTPTVFVLGILSFVSVLLFWAIQKLMSFWSVFSGDAVAHQLCCTNVNFFTSMQQNYWALMYPSSLVSVWLMLVLAGFCALLAWRVDINEFSMHHFYRNRLVRAYLGASRSRAHRQPNSFTGFDLEDDVPLCRFQSGDKTYARDLVRDCRPSYAGPYPIINTALNITRGQDLGLQERKAESFVFTPLWSGFDFSRRQVAVKKITSSEYAYQQTCKFGTAAEIRSPEDAGASLGTVMAISGAAFTSNAGFHTSPSLAFLLTVFGVRLGWWAGNPRKETWQKSSPPFGLLYLVKELTANTNTESSFVLLSDGGHFENMGLYELIRRRCRYIILSDAEEDREFKLEGIGGAIRKCRNDFGVQIDINLEALQPFGDPAVSRLHYSFGTILYPGEASCGHLLYIKSSVTGDEPLDVIEFRKSHNEFPHTSTVDQFFDESHFESYRALGHHISAQIFSMDMESLPMPDDQDPTGRVRNLFRCIESDWRKRLEESKQQSAKEKLESVSQPDEGEGKPKP
jgi:hypothetical protein